METLLWVILIALSPAGDFVAVNFANRTDCESTRVSLVRVMPYVSECLDIQIARTMWKAPDPVGNPVPGP